MSVVIEDITDTFAGAPPDQDAAHAAVQRQDEDEEFHDAAGSEDSYEDATEHFDVDALHAAQQRAQPAVDAGGFCISLAMMTLDSIVEHRMCRVTYHQETTCLRKHASRDTKKPDVRPVK